MKMTFFLFGLLGCYAANAQQKDIFDVQDHLEKKSKGKKEVYVKPLFNKKISANLFTGNNYNDFFPFSLSNGDKVISLPIDNMPCIIPDMKRFKIMPNISTDRNNKLPEISPNDHFPGKIPNPAKTFKVVAIVK